MEQPVHAVAEVLRGVRSMVQMAHSVLTKIEVVHGIRMLEPRNGLDQEIRELTWAIATLEGVTQLTPPVDEMSREITRFRDAGAQRESGREKLRIDQLTLKVKELERRVQGVISP